jgi:Icc-related predicted phosphoesterase
MKLLLFSDLHCDIVAAQRLVAQAHQVDVVVGAGDFANVRRGLDQAMAVLKAISQPLVLVPGNSESDEELSQACQGWPNAHVLHGSGTTIDRVDFYGLGGGIPVTPFGAWSFDFTEVEADQLLAACPASGVLVSHSPPQGVLDRSSRGEHLGSIAIRRAIEQRQLQLVVCGHIHASAGQEAMLGQTTVINAGPRGIIWELPRW